MKIAVWHNLPSGGGKRALYDHVKGLVARGHIVEAWCPPTADTRYLPLSELTTEHVVPLGNAPETRLQTLRRRAAGGLVIDEQIAAMQQHSRRCAEQIAAGGFDVLFANSCQTFGAPFIGRQEALPPGLPKVLYLQEPCRYLYEAMPVLPWLALPPVRQGRVRALQALHQDLRKTQNLRVQAREERANAIAFDALLVNSKFSRESMRRSYGLGARVCYLGIDTAAFAYEPGQAKDNCVVGIGAFQPHKNIEFVLDAVALMPKPRPRLVWIGNNYSAPYLATLAARAEAGGVAFEPKIGIADSELRALLRRAAVMAYAPILEPFGYAPLEANACGLPVVAVAEGGVRETVVDGVNGLLLPATDPQHMAGALESLCGDLPRAARLGEQARRHVEAHWNGEQAAERLEQELVRAREQKHVR